MDDEIVNILQNNILSSPVVHTKHNVNFFCPAENENITVLYLSYWSQFVITWPNNEPLLVLELRILGRHRTHISFHSSRRRSVWHTKVSCCSQVHYWLQFYHNELYSMISTDTRRIDNTN